MTMGRSIGVRPTRSAAARPDVEIVTAVITDLGYAPGADLSEGGRERPEWIAQGVPLQEGTRVRVLRAPHQYAEGRIVSLPEVPQRLASGLTVWGAEVDLDSGERVFIPLQNLESIR